MVTVVGVHRPVHPGMLFAIGRGYSEPLGTLLGGVMSWPRSIRCCSDASARGTRDGAAMLAIAVAVTISTAAAAALLAVGLESVVGHGLGGESHRLVRSDWFRGMESQRCHKAWCCRLVRVRHGVRIGRRGSAGRWQRERSPRRWWWWSFLPFAVFDVLGLYLLVGAGLWPSSERTLRLQQGRGAMELLVVCGFLVGLLSAYVAALWAVEGQAWDLARWKTMVVLGNNGRHGMVLLPAAVWRSSFRAMLRFPPNASIAPSCCFSPWRCSPPHTVRRCGPTMQRRRRSSILRKAMTLLIHDPDLAVHWLYTMYPVLSEQAPDGLVGHWRAPDAGWRTSCAGTVLPDRGDLSSVAVIVVAPGLDVTLEGWVEAGRRVAVDEPRRHVARSCCRGEPGARPTEAQRPNVG